MLLYINKVLNILDQVTSDIIIFNMSNPFLSSGFSLFAYVHNKDAFIPSYGMSSEFMGQQSVTIR